MVRSGLGICAAVFAVMLLIPMPLRPVSGGAAAPVPVVADLPAPQKRVGVPRVVHAFANIPAESLMEVPAPPAPLTVALEAPAPLGAAAPSAEGQLADTPPPERYRVAVPTTELRAGPSLRDRVTEVLSSGDTVAVLTTFDNRWFFVRMLDGRAEGYVDQEALAPIK